VGTDSAKEKMVKKVLTKKEKPKLVLVEYYVFGGQFACYRNSRKKGEPKEKKLLTLDNLQQKHPICRETKAIKQKNDSKKKKMAKDPCHVTPNFTISKVSENSALDCLSISFLFAAFV
jgi:hypothetical protein